MVVRYYVFMLFLLFSWFTNANEEQGYQSHELVAPFIDKLVSEHEFDRASLEKVFAQAKKKQSILDAISRPAEKRLEWHQYRKIFITKDRISRGKEFMKTYAEPLRRAEEKFGVPAEIITAIIGVETRYGSNKGSYRVIDALSTLAFDYPPRSKFFTKELVEVFLLAREQGFDINDLKGSYAGAMGFGQFIPSSYRYYAIDFDGDGVVDILNNIEDAIGSVANYFVKHKWKPGKPVAYSTEIDKAQADKLPNDVLFKKLKPRHKIGEFSSLNIPVQEGLATDDAAKLQHFLGAEGDEYWVTLHNFYVITRYNHSSMYAMAVYQLSKALS